METARNQLYCEVFNLFKSYYVVWKLLLLYITMLYVRKFKSYYVVWKLDRPSHNSDYIWMFKSYYVVWKR